MYHSNIKETSVNEHEQQVVEENLVEPFFCLFSSSGYSMETEPRCTRRGAGC